MCTCLSRESERQKTEQYLRRRGRGERERVGTGDGCQNSKEVNGGEGLEEFPASVAFPLGRPTRLTAVRPAMSFLLALRL